MTHWVIFFLCLWAAPAHGAVVATGLTGAVAGAGACDAADTITTASITPTANALVIACVTTEVSSGTAPTVTMTGNGLTWTVVNTHLSGTSLLRTTMLRALGASPSAGAATIAVATDSTSGCTWAIGEFTGTDTSGTSGSGAIVQSATNTAASTTTVTVTLAAFASANNAAAACFSSLQNATLTPGTGFSTVQNNTTGTVNRTYLVSDANDTTADIGASTTTTLNGIAIEIKEATAAASTRRKWAPRLLQFFAPVPVTTIGRSQ